MPKSMFARPHSGARRLRRYNRTQVWLVSLLGAVCVSGLGATPALATPPTPPTITISSPTGSSSLSGDVTFSVDIDQPDSSHPVTDVDFQIFSGGGQDQDVTVSSGQCAPTCTISAVFDTKTLVVPQTLLSTNENLADGLAEFDATVYTSFGPSNSVTSHFTIDNERPSLSLPDLPVNPIDFTQPVWGGDASLQTSVDVTPNAESESSIASLQFMVPNSPTVPLADATLAAPTSGTGTLTADLAGMPVGNYVVWIVAVDANGVASAPQVRGFNVGHFSITVSVPDPFNSDYDDAVITPDWTDGTTATYLNNVTAYFDGTQVGSANGFGHPHDVDGVKLWAPGHTPFPLGGSHTVRIVVTDNRGITHEASVPVTAVDPVSAAWTVTDALAGSATDIGVHIQSATSPIASVTLAGPGGPLATKTGNGSSNQLTVAAHSTQARAGHYAFTATVVQTDGYTYTVQDTVVVLRPVTLRLQPPSTASYGARARFVATATDRGTVLAGHTVVLESRAAGSTTWVVRRTATTNTSGQVTFAVTSTGSATWRVVAAATGSFAAGTSLARSVPVAAAFSGMPTTVRTSTNRTVRATLSCRPYEPATQVVLQYHAVGTSHWRVATRGSILPNGSVILQTAFTKSGEYVLRAERVAGLRIAATFSPTWTVQVS
jgi:hypothetical protein